MTRIINVAISLLLGGLLPTLAGVAQPNPPLKDLSLTQLEQRLADIDSELDQLASYTLRSGIGAVGHRSKRNWQADNKEWIRIELGEETLVDEVVLLPVLFRDSEAGVLADGFPVAFRILAGTDKTTNIVATFSAEDHVLPRIAPLVVPFQPVTASWIGIEVTTFSARINDKLHWLQLSEVLVFRGIENVSLHKPALVSPLSMSDKGATRRRFLTDGFGPYLMDAAGGSQSRHRVIHIHAQEPPPTLTMDLNSPVPVNQVNLHTAFASRTIPSPQFDCWAVPRHVRVTGANQPDFSDQTFLTEYEQNSIYDHTPIIMRRFPETLCRYIRLEILDPKPVVSVGKTSSTISFSEIEVLSRGRNIAIGAPVTLSPGLSAEDAALVRLTDGFNYYGKILSLRDWMNQLARRHDLETVRPLVAAELARRYARQKTHLQRMIWLALLLVTGIIITILIDRMIRMSHIAKIRERFAADLHDELGADLHSISLLSDLANDAKTDPKKLDTILQHIRTAIEDTSTSVRHCSNMQSGTPSKIGLREDLQRIAERIVVHLEHDISIEGEDILSKLKPRTRSDLFLFYKESLINICRHSEATRLSTRLVANRKRICLTITDNGQGLSDSAGTGIPRSLKRRARLMGARVSTNTPADGGTTITLKLRPRRGWGMRRDARDGIRGTRCGMRDGTGGEG